MKTDKIEEFLGEVEKTVAVVPGEEGLVLGCLRADIPSVRAELVVLKEGDRRLRTMLAICHAGALLYSDDGELQDNREQPFIDFKRDSVDEIRKKLGRRFLAFVKKEGGDDEDRKD